MLISHRKEIRKLTFGALALRLASQLRNTITELLDWEAARFPYESYIVATQTKKLSIFF